MYIVIGVFTMKKFKKYAGAKDMGYGFEKNAGQDPGYGIRI